MSNLWLLIIGMSLPGAAVGVKKVVKLHIIAFGQNVVELWKDSSV